MALRNRLAVALLLTIIVAASSFAWYYGATRYDAGYERGIKKGVDSISELSKDISFTGEELQKFQSIKDRIIIYNTDPEFPGVRELEWISMRNSTSADWDLPMKSMEYLCFWSGRGSEGEWEAAVSIYNEPGSTADYVVEVSRFTWHSLEVRLDGNIMATFPQVTNDTTSLGYTTFHLTP